MSIIHQIGGLIAEIEDIQLCLLKPGGKSTLKDNLKVYVMFTIQELKDSLQKKQASLLEFQLELERQKTAKIMIEIEDAQQETMSLKGNRKGKSFHHLCLWICRRLIHLIIFSFLSPHLFGSISRRFPSIESMSWYL